MGIQIWGFAMVSIKDVPAEARWEIATRSANFATVARDAMLRKAFDNDEIIDEIEQRIWAEGGRAVRDIAISLGLPSGNAIEIDEALGVVSAIILGPGFDAEVTEASESRVNGRITSCPMLNTHKELGVPTTGTHLHCQAFCENGIQGMNPRYAMVYTKRMCRGDDCCEYAIELKR
jgi:hypothetical protein